MTAILAAIFAALDAAIDTVINAVTDRVVAAWLEEPAQAAKEEGLDSLCGNPTKAREQ